ncbi:MAG: nitroreductase [Saprospiraceae bacterium]
MRKELLPEPEVDSEILKNIYHRRAVRKYTTELVDQAVIEQIIDAGRMAPSAINEQPWKFYVLTDKETISAFSKEIRKVAAKHFMKSGPGKIVKTIVSLLHFPHKTDFFKSGDPVFHDAPVVIFITAPVDNEWAALDIGMCSQNMMLAAKSLGLESCPIGFGKYVEQTKMYSRLKILSSEKVHISIIFGYGDETPEVHKRITDNVMYID